MKQPLNDPSGKGDPASAERRRARMKSAQSVRFEDDVV